MRTVNKSVYKFFVAFLQIPPPRPLPINNHVAMDDCASPACLWEQYSLGAKEGVAGNSSGYGASRWVARILLGVMRLL